MNTYLCALIQPDGKEVRLMEVFTAASPAEAREAAESKWAGNNEAEPGSTVLVFTPAT